MANGDNPQGNVALLIDADNASPATLDPVLTVLAELGTVNIRRIYGNWKKPALKGWADLSLKHGIEPFQQFDITKGKNATDMKMTIDAMDLLFRARVTGFGIMSSDSDFMPLAMRIRQEGLPSTASARRARRRASARRARASSTSARWSRRTRPKRPPPPPRRRLPAGSTPRSSRC